MIDPTSRRNWFPVILAGLTILLATGIYASQYRGDMPFSISSEVISNFKIPVRELKQTSSVTSAGYQSAVLTIIATYKTNKNAQSAYDALIVLHVPAVEQSFHIDLIIAFGKLVGGDGADGEARLQALMAQNSWFTM